MNLFGYNIRSPFQRALFVPGGRKAASNSGSSKSGFQLRPNDGQGPYTKYFANYIPRKIEASFYEFLREAIPVIDAAINRLVSLDGHIEVKGNNEALVEEIQEWFYNVPVNDMQKGIQAFHQNWTGEAFEQGFALGEFVTDRKRTDIVQLRVADSKYIQFKRSETGLDAYQKADNDLDWRLLANTGNLLYFSINNENQNPHGVPLFRSCEFVGKILATMDNSLLNVWERFGDPSFSVIYKTSKKDGADLATRRATIETEFNTAIRAKREGKSADFIRAIDTNSELDIKVIGADGQVLDLEVPARHILEQIVAKSGLPSWMLGLQWSTTQSLSDNEAEILLADVATRQAAKMPYFFRLIRTLLLLRGRPWKKGDWWLEWATPNLRDQVKLAQARFLNAQADMMSTQAASGTPTNVPGKSVGRGTDNYTKKIRDFWKTFYKGDPHRDAFCMMIDHGLMDNWPVGGLPGEKVFHSCEKESRPTPWPAMDAIEDTFIQRITEDWNSAKETIFTLLRLPPSDKVSKAPDDPFEMSDEQKPAILLCLKKFAEIYNPLDMNSPTLFYYGSALSAGFIEMARQLGAERPILNIIKSKPLFERLCADGFDLVKNAATIEKKAAILEELQTVIMGGGNYFDAARRLENKFGNANSDWVRLVRSEMTRASERGQREEAKARGETRLEFMAGPDACDLCQSLIGDYPIDECPMPIDDTHPRCHCKTRPAITTVYPM
jgi:hypothetical protein